MADLGTLLSGFMQEQQKLLAEQNARLNAFIENAGPPAKKKIKKDPNAPKKPASSYILFMSEFTPLFKKENPNLTQKEVMTAVGHRWSQLPADKKVKYDRQSAELKAKYQAAMEAYKKKLSGEEDDIDLGES
jgi:hypothetical protein